MIYRAIFTTAVVLFSGLTFAQNAPVPKDPLATPGIDKREAVLDKRVEQGVGSGQITAREARRLQRADALIDKAQDHAAADGVVSRGERKHIRSMQSTESKAIHHQKHDRQVDLNLDGKKDRKG